MIMRKIVSIFVGMLLCVALYAQSPAQHGANYAKQIVGHAAKNNFKAITDCCMEAYRYLADITADEYNAFMESFSEAVYEQCEATSLGEEFADNLIVTFEEIMSDIGLELEEAEVEDADIDEYSLEW